MDKIFVGFSGGVYSAVSARLLQKDFHVCPVFLDNGVGDGAREAAEAAAFMGLELKTVDIRRELDARVCAPFAESYLRGETPNPCILCNPTVKFRALCAYADELGAHWVATGHYARAENGALYKGRPENDQSYMLCRLLPSQAERLLMPLGGYAKTEVRKLAERMGLPVAAKPDSMEICFIPDGDHARWIERRCGKLPEGDVLYNGQVIARHRGIHRYTLGQRRGLGFAAGKRVYVSEIRPESNEIVLSDGEDLYADTLNAHSMNWLIEEPQAPFRCAVRVRHSKTEYAAIAQARPGGGLFARFDEPVRAPTRGQSAVLYDGDRLLGGGFIL